MGLRKLLDPINVATTMPDAANETAEHTRSVIEMASSCCPLNCNVIKNQSLPGMDHGGDWDCRHLLFFYERESASPYKLPELAHVPLNRPDDVTGLLVSDQVEYDAKWTYSVKDRKRELLESQQEMRMCSGQSTVLGPKDDMHWTLTSIREHTPSVTCLIALIVVYSEYDRWCNTYS